MGARVREGPLADPPLPLGFLVFFLGVVGALVGAAVVAALLVGEFVGGMLALGAFVVSWTAGVAGDDDDGDDDGDDGPAWLPSHGSLARAASTSTRAGGVCCAGGVLLA